MDVIAEVGKVAKSSTVTEWLRCRASLYNELPYN